MESMLRSLREKSANLLTSSSGGTPIRKDLEKLCRMTERIGALLDDAEEREIRESTVKLWLDELRDLAYDAEDVIEEFEYELLRNQLESKKEQRATKRERKPIVSKIKKINDRFNEIYRLRRALKLRKEDRQRHRTELLEPPVRIPSSRLVDEEGVSGRGKDKQKVIDMLLSDGSHCNDGIRVVSIVGMGGLGKTTLAQQVYIDALVQSHFVTKSWVCVSEPFDVTRITKTILQSIDWRRSELEELSPLQESLRETLEGKRFLLVLDDVWNENIIYWEAVLYSLLSGAEGSRVLITTRSEKVSRISGAGEGNMYRLGLLSKEDCWSLFKQFAFHGRECDDYPKLVTTGQQIVDRCKGLPSAVKMLGRILYFNFDEDHWKDILGTDLWELQEAKDDIIPALRLSYYHLSSPLRVCFAYCGVFPKGHYFIKDELVCLWMAQCYVWPTHGRSMEDVARIYIDDLRQRSFFQYCGGGRFKMHDLIHHLALSVSPGECAKIEGVKLSNSLEKARHLWLEGQAETQRLLMPCGSNDKLQLLRTLYMIKKGPGCFSAKFLDDVFLSTKRLRVLYLCDDEISELPDSIGGLKHLRYLGISGEQLRRLPETLGNLLFLQTLQVKRARSLEELPKSLKSLVNLRYLKLHRF